MSPQELTNVVASMAAEHGLPGAAVGVRAGGREMIACHGVTSAENPLPVDRDTLFVVGSVAKTFTATAVLSLVAQGRVELDTAVRRYVPEFTLPDEQAADQVTVAQLLNHTAGLDWRIRVETGEGDDALAAYVAALAGHPLLAPPGTRTSYSQVGYNLAGRVVEKVTGLTFERAVASMLLEPLGMRHSVYTAAEAITRRVAVGHNLHTDHTLRVARQWKDTRANNPGGDLASSVADLLRWAQFHLDAGATRDGEQLVPAAAMRRMQTPTAPLTGSTLGDAIGLGWFLREVDGVRLVGHAGSANGQFAELHLVPDRDVAVVALSNAGPDAGLAFNRAVVEWTLEQYAHVIDRTPQPLPFNPVSASEVTGVYANDMMNVIICADQAELTVACGIKPEIRAATDTELPPDLPPAAFGLLPDRDNEFLITSGGMSGQRGFFTRDPAGAVIAVDLAGRTFQRVLPRTHAI